MDLLNFVAYWSGVGSAVGNEESWLDLVEESRFATPAQPPVVDLASETGPNPEPGSGFDILVAWQGRALGLLSPLLGGLPWDRQRFLTAARSRFHDEMSTRAARAAPEDSESVA
jgi:hypothetical protein